MVIDLFIIVGVYDSHVIMSCYYRTPVDRDYNKMTEQHCSQVVTHYSPGQFQCPDNISIDHNNNVLITDNDANCIVIFTQGGEFIQTINTDRPCAITISPTGYLITGHDVADNKIRVWSDTYQCIKMFGKKGSKQGEFYNITGMAIDSSGTIYVTEWYNKRLQVISNS